MKFKARYLYRNDRMVILGNPLCYSPGCTRYARQQSGLCAWHEGRRNARKLWWGEQAPPERDSTGVNALWKREKARCAEVQREYPTPCWDHPGDCSRKGTGYPMVSHAGRPVMLHRLALCLREYPADDRAQASHLCVTGSRQPNRCVRPDHLKWETPKENMARVVDHGQRLSDEDVRALRMLFVVASGDVVDRMLAIQRVFHLHWAHRLLDAARGITYADVEGRTTVAEVNDALRQAVVVEPRVLFAQASLDLGEQP